MQKPVLTIPEPRIAHLSFCDTTPKAFRYWVDHLPLANLGELSRQLYHGIIEVNQLLCQPAARLQFLELMRPRIRFVCTELSRHYLGMSVSLPEKQRKIANLSQALQMHLASGYKLTLMEMLDSGNIDRQRKVLAQVCHRALSELGATILRAQQLYTGSPPGSWLETHQLFRFARANELHDLEVQDDQRRQRPTSTVAEAYHHTLLMGCARSNQLRQKEQELVGELFELWANRVRCAPDLAATSVFVVDTESDKPPRYRSLGATAGENRVWGLDTGSLATQIQDHLHQKPQPVPSGAAGRKPAPPPVTGLPVVDGVSDSLLTHLAQALALLTERNFNRLATDGQLEVCAGLSAAHYFVAGQKPFPEFIIGNESAAALEPENRFMKPVRTDAWSEAHDAGVSEDRLRAHADIPIHYQKAGASHNTLQGRNLPRAYRTRIVNTSPGGYCVVWAASIPVTLQTGEILGVREQPGHPWSIAIVRWLRQARGEGTQVGIEVIGPGATPCGVQLIQKTGNSSEFLRGLLLPAIPGTHRPESLVTPRVPFQSGNRISLLHQGRQEQGLLGRQLAGTGSVSQFELRLYKRPDEPDPGLKRRKNPFASDDGDFDSLWPDL